MEDDTVAGIIQIFARTLSMGFRFRKRIKTVPGVQATLSKSGISTSDPGPGAAVNFSSRGTRATVGLPGTGLSDSETPSGRRNGPGQAQSLAGRRARRMEWLAWFIFAVVLVVAVLAFGH